MKRSWKNFRLDKKKVYQFIGQAVVYSTLYISAVAGTVFMFLQGMTYQEEKEMELIKEILFWWMLIDNILLCVSKIWRQHTIDMLSHDK